MDPCNTTHRAMALDHVPARPVPAVTTRASPEQRPHPRPRGLEPRKQFQCRSSARPAPPASNPGYAAVAVIAAVVVLTAACSVRQAARKFVLDHRGGEIRCLSGTGTAASADRPPALGVPHQRRLARTSPSFGDLRM